MIVRPLTALRCALALLVLAVLAAPAGADTWTTYAYPNDMRDVVRVDQTLWIATTGGALRYDLSTGTFTQLTRRASGGPLSQNLTCLAWDESDRLLFVGSSDFGVSQYDPEADRWSRFEFIPSNDITALAARNGLVYVGTSSGFAIRRSASRTDICNDIDRGCCGSDPSQCDFPSFEVRDWAAGDGLLWAATASGPVEFADGKWRAHGGGAVNGTRSIEVFDGQVFAAGPGFAEVFRWNSATSAWESAGAGLRGGQGLEDVVRLVHAGSSLYLCCNYGLFRWTGDAWTGTGLEDVSVRGVAALDQPSRDLAVATQSGLSVRTLVGPGTQWQGLQASGPPYNIAGAAVAAAKDGTIYLGTLGGVMALSTSGGWTGFRNGQQGIGGDDIYSLFADSRSRLWLGKCCCPSTPSCPVQFIDGSTVSPALQAWDGWGIAEDGAGRIWVGSNIDGLTVLDASGNRIANVAPAGGGLSSSSVRAVGVRGNDVWIGHEAQGLQIARTGGNPANPAGYTWRSFNTGSSAIPDQAVVAIEMRGRDTWVLTSSYLVQYTDEVKVHQYPLNFDGEPRRGNGLAIDRSGNKWVGTSNGLLKVDAAGATTLLTTLNSDLISDEILDAELDPKTGDILFATRIGFSRLRPGASPGGPSAAFYLFPNPFRPEEVARVKVGGGTADNAEVFDVAGRMVARFSPALGWDGNAIDGRPVAPGVYLVVVDGQGPLRLALLR